MEDEILPYMPDQLIVNEYLPGQGITNHVDCESCFDDVIVSLSIGSPAVINFVHKDDKSRVIPLLLESRSLMVITGPARYEWMHGIKGIKNETWEGNKFPRRRRLSLTFRKVTLESEEPETAPEETVSEEA